MRDQLVDQVNLYWLDKNGLVLPQKGTNSGNGLLYSAMFIALCDVMGGAELVQKVWFLTRANACMLKPGDLARDPENSQKQESWDDYLGVIVACIILGNTDIPKKILSYGLRHLFIYQTSSPLKGDAFIGRVLFLWPLCWSAAYPWARYLLYPLIWLFGLTMTPNAGDPGNIETQWLYFYGAKKLGFRFAKFDQLSSMLLAAFKAYYDPTHPFISCFPTKF